MTTEEFSYTKTVEVEESEQVVVCDECGTEIDDGEPSVHYTPSKSGEWPYRSTTPELDYHASCVGEVTISEDPITWYHPEDVEGDKVIFALGKKFYLILVSTTFYNIIFPFASSIAYSMGVFRNVGNNGGPILLIVVLTYILFNITIVVMLTIFINSYGYKGIAQYDP